MDFTGGFVLSYDANVKINSELSAIASTQAPKQSSNIEAADFWVWLSKLWRVDVLGTCVIGLALAPVPVVAWLQPRCFSEPPLPHSLQLTPNTSQLLIE